MCCVQFHLHSCVAMPFYFSEPLFFLKCMSVVIMNQTRELISARKTSHKHNNKDLSCLRQLSLACLFAFLGLSVLGCTSGGVDIACICTRDGEELP